MFLFRRFVFYPLLALVAAGLIFVSLGRQPWASQAPVSQSGAPGKNNSLNFGPDALARIDPGDGHLLFSPRNARGLPQTLHIAIKKGAPVNPGATDRGARLLVSETIARSFAGKEVALEIDVRPMPISSAPKIAVSWQGADGAILWAQLDCGAEAKTLRLTLPAVGAPQAIGLYVINPLGNEAFALEIGEIRLAAAN